MGVANEQEFHQEIKVASQLARQAGDVIMKIYDTKYEVASKGKAGPVTEADLRSSELIVEGLHEAFPHDLVVSEEALPQGGQAAERVWYVDPLDGTKEFISKNGEFSVMIGLAINGHARVGVVYKPVGAVLFWGITDKEACLEQDGTRTPLKVSNQAVLRELRLVVSRSHRLPVIDQVRDRLGITQEIPSGSVGLKNRNDCEGWRGSLRGSFWIYECVGCLRARSRVERCGRTIDRSWRRVDRLWDGGSYGTREVSLPRTVCATIKWLRPSHRSYGKQSSYREESCVKDDAQAFECGSAGHDKSFPITPHPSRVMM